MLSAHLVLFWSAWLLLSTGTHPHGRHKGGRRMVGAHNSNKAYAKCSRVLPAKTIISAAKRDEMDRAGKMSCCSGTAIRIRVLCCRVLCNNYNCHFVADWDCSF